MQMRGTDRWMSQGAVRKADADHFRQAPMGDASDTAKQGCFWVHKTSIGAANEAEAVAQEQLQAESIKACF